MAGPTDERADLIIPLGLPDPPGSRPTQETKAQARGRLLKYVGRIRRGEKVPCYVVPIDGSRRPARIEMHALDAPGPAAVPSRRGAPRRQLPIERLRQHLADQSLESCSLTTHARLLRVARSTLVARLRELGLK